MCVNVCLHVCMCIMVSYVFLCVKDSEIRVASRIWGRSYLQGRGHLPRRYTTEEHVATDGLEILGEVGLCALFPL